MGGDLVRNHTLPHVIKIRQAEVLLWRDVAKHGRPVPGRHRRPDGAGDVVVAGRDVGHNRPEDVERRFIAPLLL